MDPLSLFPPYGIDQTIHVAVLIGVLVLLGLTEWFGWVFSGLVVPGYLASLFVLEPMSATAVLIEAVLTFLFARLLSNVASRSGAWNVIFGRERFLLLVFVSVVVRQACQTWLFPDTLRLLDDVLGTNYRWGASLSSVGLVLVPLTANMFWKLDLRRGALQVAVPTVLTYLLLAYVLLPFTNLSFSKLELTYENVALDFLSSPKAYILLLTGAYLGSRYNLLYGWDYAGILVPALIGLGWVAPHRLVTTLIETVVLVLAVRAITRLPGLRTMNLEGPRKVALVFFVSFVIKWTMGWFTGPSVLGYQVTDLFGLGYLLSSLLAVKILQKDTTPRIIVPTFIVSAATFLIGSALGFGLDKLAPAPPPVVTLAPIAAPSPPTTMLNKTALGVLAMGHVRARLDHGELPIARTQAELDQYKALWTGIDRWLAAPTDANRASVEQHAKPLGLALVKIERVANRDAWALFEQEERLAGEVGWDTAVLVPGAPGPVIAVPRPGREAPSAEVAAALCERVACKIVIASGVDMDDRPAHAIARARLHGPVFEVRVDPSLAVGKAVFHVANEAPDVNVSELWPGLQLSWTSAGGGSHLGASVLRASPADYWKILVEKLPAIPVVRGVSLEGWYARNFTDATRVIGDEPALEITGPAPSQSELRFLEVVIARAALARDLDRAQVMAQLVGYGVQLLADGVDGKAVWVLAEPQRRLGWGVFAGRVEDGKPLTIEAPRPGREAGTGRLAVELFHHANASSLILADGDVPADRVDADPAAPWNVGTSFEAFHQAVHDERHEIPGAAILQVRGFGVTQTVKESVVLMMSRAQPRADRVPKELATLVSQAGPIGALGSVRLDDGAPELVDLTGTGNPQLAYCGKFETTTCALLWFSEAARDEYRDADRERELAKLARLQIPSVSGGATAALLEPGLTIGPVPPELVARFTEIEKVALTYAQGRNIHLLRKLPAGALRAGFSDEMGRPFLLLELGDGTHVMRAVVPIPGGTERVIVNDAAQVGVALARRPQIVIVGGRQ